MANSAFTNGRIDPVPGDNLLDNPNFDIWQRGTSFTGSSVDDYTADRSRVGITSTTSTTISRVSSTLPNRTYDFQADISGATSATAVLWGQAIELSTAKSMLGKDATFSFKRNSNIGSFNVNIAWRDSFSSGSNIVSIYNSAINQTVDGWQAHEVNLSSIPSPNASNTALWVIINIGSSSLNDIIRLNEMKFEEGSQATDFQVPNKSLELQKCQRFYAKTYNIDIFPGATSTTPGSISSTADSTNAFVGAGTWRYPARMRSTPSITIYSPLTGAAGKVLSDNTDGDGVANNIGDSACYIHRNNDSSGVGLGSFIYAHAVAEAEL